SCVDNFHRPAADVQCPNPLLGISHSISSACPMSAPAVPHPMIRSFLKAILGVFVVGNVLGAEPSNYFVFISNERSGDVTVIDGSNDTVTSTFAVGKRPRGIHPAPDGKRIFVALSGSPRMAPGMDTERAPADKTADGMGVIDS